MSEPLLLNTLEEAASWLSEKTKSTITVRQVLNAEIIHHSRLPMRVNSNRNRYSRLYITFPIDAKFSHYKFVDDKGFVFVRYARWHSVPMFYCHLGELLTHGETILSIALCPEDDYGDGETYVLLEPALIGPWRLARGQLANLSMVRIKKEGLQDMLKQFISPDKVSTKLTEAQDDKLNCQMEARKLWQQDSTLTQAAIMKSIKVAPYFKKYTGKNTVSSWLSEIDPRPKESRRGRPKKIPA